MSWSARVKVVSIAKRVWRVERGDGATYSTSHRVHMDTLETRTEDITDEELVRDVTCSPMLQDFEEISYSCVTTHQDDSWKMWELLNLR